MPKKEKVSKEEKKEEKENVNCLKFEDSIDETNLLDEKKESLLILATLGMTKEYLGQELDVSKIHKLKNQTIEYYNRYQLVQGKKVAGVLKQKESN